MTASPATWLFVSGAVRRTLAAGDAGFGVTIDWIVASSWFGPSKPTRMLLPATSPVVLETRMPVAPSARGLVQGRLEAVRTRLERVRDDAAVVPVLVGRVTRRRVEDVRDRPGPLREDDRPAVLLDAVQDRVRRSEEVALDPDVRVDGVALAAVGEVRARRPHEVAAERVDVVRELDVVERVRDPELVLDLGLAPLAGARVRVVVAEVVRTDVGAVEDRPERVVAVQVDTPGVPGGRIRLRVQRPGDRVRTRRPEGGIHRIVRRFPALDAPVGHGAALWRSCGSSSASRRGSTTGG